MRWESQPLKKIALKELCASVDGLRRRGCRIVQICCTKIAGNRFELTYSFDKDYRFTSLRVTIPAEAEVPSITGIYGGAFLYENEIKELFGVKFKGMNVDYNGHLYKKKTKAPFSVETDKEGESCQKG